MKSEFVVALNCLSDLLMTEVVNWFVVGYQAVAKKMVDRRVSSCTTDVLLMESNEADKQPKEVYEQLLATFSKEGQWQREGPRPPSPIVPDAWLRLKFFHRQGCSRISRFNWLTFLLKRALHFAAKLSTRDIQKCNCCSVPSYDLFASTRKYFTRQRRPVFTDWQIEKHAVVSAFSAGRQLWRQFGW